MKFTVFLAASAALSAQIRVGIIGTDTSHVPAFTQMLNDPKADNTSLLFAAQICNSLNQLPRVETALSRIARTQPNSPEVWFDLAGVQALQNKETQAIDSLRVALNASAKRLAKDSNAPNLHSNALVDSRLNSIRQSPAFQQLIAGSK